jgi:hypothetical protein
MFNSIKNFYAESYSGKEKAWRVFFFGYLILLFPYAIFFGVFKNSPDVLYFMSVVRLIYNLWLIIALWKCSPNVSYRFFNILTKVFAVFVVFDCYISIQILIH